MTKDDIRQHIAERKKKFQGLELLSAQIIKNVQGLELFQQAKTVGAYMPLPDEVDITPFFHSVGKVFYIPTFDEARGSYRLAEYSPNLKKGRFGISEPTHPVYAPEEIDLIIVPGVAFDRAGHRLGRGGGFYDRLLPQYCAIRVGVCFNFQWVESIPVEPHDCHVSHVITES